MEKLGRIVFILFVISLVIFGVVYIDYYDMKHQDKLPRIAIKKNVNENLEVYNAVFYRVWYCKTTKRYTIGSYSDLDAICPGSSEENQLEDSLETKLLDENLTLFSEYFDEEYINEMTNEEIDDALGFIIGYGKVKYKNSEDENGKVKKAPDGNKLIIKGEYKLKNNEYVFEYNEEKTYCINSEDKSISEFKNGECTNYKKQKVDNIVCKIKPNTNLKDSQYLAKLCEEL